MILNKERTLEFSNWYLILYAILSIFVASNLSLESLKNTTFKFIFYSFGFYYFYLSSLQNFFDLNNFNLYVL